jgi:hypothetical protein
MRVFETGIVWKLKTSIDYLTYVFASRTFSSTDKCHGNRYQKTLVSIRKTELYISFSHLQTKWILWVIKNTVSIMKSPHSLARLEVSYLRQILYPSSDRELFCRISHYFEKVLISHCHRTINISHKQLENV